MKGDFSKWGLSSADNYSGVLHQQGRVLLDQDWNAAQQIQALWREQAGRDIVGDGVVAVPAAAPDSLQILGASASAGGVELKLAPGRAWVDGVLLHYDASSALNAEYLQPPLQDPPFDVSSIAAGVRDAVVLEVWDEALSAFQDPLTLLEPALGGPDTTERVQTYLAVKLKRLQPGEDCGDLDLVDDVGSRGRLTVTPSPTTVIPGPCPVPDSGGYSGFEHCLYRIEIAEPKAGVARFKWSQFNGGLVGRGEYTPIDAGSGTVAITANLSMLEQSGLDDFYFEALAFDPADGHWRVRMSAQAALGAGGTLALTAVEGGWPAPMETAFFRLWNRIENVGDFPLGLPLDNELNDGIRLAFDTPASGLYVPGDYWTFPARAAGVAFDPSVWPNAAPPQGVVHHRAALGVLTWSGSAPTSLMLGKDDIHDCRQPFLPLAKMRGCCTYTVGDGRHSFGQFTSIQAAVDALPVEGGTICVRKGTYDESVRIRGRVNVRIHGCGPSTRVRAIQDQRQGALPALWIRDCDGVALEDMAIESGPRSAVQIDNARHVQVRRCLIQMRDEDTVWQAIYARGDDILIEHNIIEVIDPRDLKAGIVPGAPRLPPKLGDPKAPSSVHTRPDPVWRGEATRGGIQLAGGSDRVRIAHNLIRGGIWNGITLGSLTAVDGRPDDDIPDKPQPPDRCHPCEPPDLSDDEIGDDGRPRYVSTGDLYDIEIVANRITDMGINGIGVVRYFDLAKGGDLIGVHGLRIADNVIARCLYRDPGRPRDAFALLIAYGGISLAKVTDLRIIGNEIVQNGNRFQLPVCGVFALIVQGLQVDANRIVDNGPRDGVLREPQPGIRGGVHVWLVLPQIEAPAAAMLASDLKADTRLVPRNGATTLMVRDNVIVAPLGRALTCFAVGPATVARNRLVTQGNTGTGLDRIAATVLIGDLGLSNEWTLGLLSLLVLMIAGGGKFDDRKIFCEYARTFGVYDTSRKPPALWPPLVRRWATGKLLLSENQITLDVIDDEGLLGITSVLVASLDDVAMVDNQIEISSTQQVYVFANLAIGGSVRMADNRFSETWMRAAYSGVSMGLMNTTTGNQSTHCMRANAMLPNLLVFRDNLSLIEAFCEDICGHRNV